MAEDDRKITAIKEMLSYHRELNQDIDNEIERLERMKSKAHYVGAVAYSDMPKSSSYISDRTADQATRILDLESEILGMIQERDVQKARIERMVKCLRKSGERAVIRMRYLDVASWNEVQKMLYGSNEDYEDKLENYKQRMFRLHSSAIESLAKIKRL